MGAGGRQSTRASQLTMFSHVGMSTPDTVPRSVPAPYARAPVSDCPHRRHCSFTLPAPGARADAHGASLPASSRHASPCGRTQAAAALPPPPPSPSRAPARARARACSPSRRGAVASERAVAPPTGRAQRRRDVGMRDGLRDGGREGGEGGREKGEGSGARLPPQCARGAHPRPKPTMTHLWRPPDRAMDRTMPSKERCPLPPTGDNFERDA